MAHKFTGANIVFKHQRPQQVVYSDRVALAAFIGWATEAIESCPLSEDAKVVMDALIAGQQQHYDYTNFTVAYLSSFLQWVSLASEYYTPGEVACKMVTTLTEYRDQLDRYEHQIRNYWFQ